MNAWNHVDYQHYHVPPFGVVITTDTNWKVTAITCGMYTGARGGEGAVAGPTAARPVLTRWKLFKIIILSCGNILSSVFC